jgi:hypothetical protein
MGDLEKLQFFEVYLLKNAIPARNCTGTLKPTGFRGSPRTN